MVFEDIKPAAKFHLIAIPKKHIEDIGHLRARHIPLVRKLKNAGVTALELFMRAHEGCVRKGVRTPTSLIAMQTHAGFHRRGYTSVPHLHMHIVAPTNEMNEDSIERIFGENNFRFISVC